MKLLVLLVVLAVRRLDISFPPALSDPDRFFRFNQRISQRFGQGSLKHWLVAVLVPALVVGLLMCVLDEWLGGLVGWFAGAIILLWLLGVESDFKHVDELILNGRMQRQKDFEQTASSIFAMPESLEAGHGASAYFAALLNRIVHQHFRFLFASVFWLMVGGYGLLVMYVMNRWWLEQKISPVTSLEPPAAEGEAEEVEQAVYGDTSPREYAALLDEAMYWIPARLILLCMALAGDFNRVRDAVAGWTRLETPDALMEKGLYAAMESAPDEADNLESGVRLLQATQSVLTRCMAIWLMFFAIWVILT